MDRIIVRTFPYELTVPRPLDPRYFAPCYAAEAESKGLATKLIISVILTLSILILTGCAQNLIRITEYSGAALPLPGINAAAGGCVIASRGEISGRVVYEGENCLFDSEAMK